MQKTSAQKSEAHKEAMKMVETAIEEMRSGRDETTQTFNTQEIHDLAAAEEFYLIGGRNWTIGGRKPTGVGLAYSHRVGLVIANSQELADQIAKELTPRRHLELVAA
jgi:hypothetical protein